MNDENYESSSYEEYISKYYSDVLVKIENKDVSEKCEIPVLIQFIGYILEEQNKNVVQYYWNRFL